ncbi:MAG: S41 family peptidase [Candidatus Eremiobacteraeota bacterium]|nr:S41 family peptidase [Candidatus Eremiobacteraeota bacterium]
MSSKIRALAAALVVAIVAIAGALYLGYRSGLSVAQLGSMRTTDVASISDLRSLFAGNGEQEALDLAFRSVVEKFYKPVDAQRLLDGERSGLLTTLRHDKHVSNAVLPSAKAVGDFAQDRAIADRQLAYAESHYGNAASEAELTQAAISGMTNALRDPYTVYLTPHEMQGLNESLAGGNFGGIGVYIVQDPKNGDILVDPIETLPAARSGMKPGDEVVQVDGHTTHGLKLDLVERMIRGNPGTVVTIVVHPYKKPSTHTYRVVREIIHVPTVKAKQEDGFAYIRLLDFGQTSADEMRRALAQARANNSRGYILDLRDNGGGLLGAAVRISSYFIPSGTIVSTIDRQGRREDQPAFGTSMPGLSPLVILVNKYTASASEITAGALQDYGLAKLVGTKTFGKGVVQSIYPLPDNGALKITTARYLTPLGRDIQHKGITPDIVVTQNPDPTLMDTKNDRQLAAAKAYLKKQTIR